MIWTLLVIILGNCCQLINTDRFNGTEKGNVKICLEGILTVNVTVDILL